MMHLFLFGFGTVCAFASWHAPTFTMKEVTPEGLVDAEPGLRPGTEKKISWASADHKKTRLGIAYIHGFSASPDEIAPTMEGLGHNVYFTRLKGHGKDGASLAAATPGDWVADVEEAVAMAEKIGERPVLVGSSMGGMLSLWAALQSNRLAGVVLISPAFAPKDKKAKILLWPGGLWLAKKLNGPERKWEPKNPAQARIWTYAYPLEAVKNMLELVEGINQLDFGKLTAPSLVIYTDSDESVDVKRITDAFEKFGGRKQILKVEGSEHVLAGDATSPSTTALVRGYLQGFLTGL